jgi:hypothetical protein
VLLFDPPNSWKLSKANRSWLLPCLLIGVVALLWYGAHWALFSSEQPGGSSIPGLTCGIVAGLLMLYLFSYALRKLKWLGWWFRRNKTSHWLRQHVWLGLLTVPLVIVHTARITHWGPLNVALMIAYAVVIASGVWGLILQQSVPTRLLEDVPDETIRSQIPQLTEQLRQEAELLVLATCGPPPAVTTGPVEIPLSLKNHIGVVRDARSGKGTGLLALMPPEPIPDTEPLRQYFHETVDLYMRPTVGSRSKLFLRAKIEKDFKDLKGRLPAEALPIIEALRDVCDRRRQFEDEERLHSWLHTWVAFHLVSSAALIVLLGSHVFTAIYYW